MIRIFKMTAVVVPVVATIALAVAARVEYTARVRELEQRLEAITIERDELGAELEHSRAAAVDMTGGAESDVETAAAGADLGTVFPVHPDDFLFYTSAYGIRVSPFLGIEQQHDGIDIAATWRAQVVAIADGVVREHWPAPGTPYPGGGTYRGHPVYGAMVLIDHGDGVESLYAHMHSTRVRQGQIIRSGEIIGRVGATGQATGAHLHFEILVDGAARNPLHYVPDPRAMAIAGTR